jgi:hypothetical protein
MHSSSPVTVVAALAASLTIATAGAQTPGFAPWRDIVLESDVSGWASGRMSITDDARGRIVSFGCHNAVSVFADTWEWGGSHWLPCDPARLPPFRRDGGFAYDSARRRVVMFGGAWQTNLNDTWEWDGETWTQRTLPTSPSARSGCTAAYDAARGRVVLFGGQVFGDTWEYDGTTWVQRFPANAPSSRRDHVMAYDEQRQRIVLHGGQSFAPYVISTETWEWDGTNWSLQSAAGPGSLPHALVFDRVRQRCVMFGGYPQATATFEWNGTTWTMASPSAPFPATYTPPLMARDPGSGSAVVFANGGRWLWTGAGWTLQTTLTLPTDRDTTVACTDTVRNRVVAYTSTDGTFEWDGVNWTGLAPTTALRYMPMVFDAARVVCVQFGGQASNGALNDDTRTWNGTAWTTVPAPARPSPRYFAQMAYDAARQRVVLFGGVGPNPSNPGPPPIYGDTWTFDGVTWTQQLGPGPSARFGHVMAYDPLRQVVVLHCGGTFGASNNETWEWNGTAWLQRTPLVAPPIRSGAAFGFDPNRGALVLTAGSWTTPLTDTWTWDGVAWTQVAMQHPVWPRYGGTFALDPSRQELMLLGGNVRDFSTVLPRRDAQWLRLAVTTPQSTSLGASCAAGTPPRLSSSLPYVGNADFAVDLLDGNPQVLCFVGFAYAVQAQPIGPCTLQVGGTPVMLAAITSPAGFARFAIPLPQTQALVGMQLVAQGGAWSTTGPLFGFDLTAARVMSFGD